MKRLFIVLFILCTLTTNAQKSEWAYLDNRSTGSYDFIKQNPDCDGKGVVIFVLDCGADPSIPGLTQTSHGELKMIDIQDFSGQLIIPMSEGDIELRNSKKYLVSGDHSITGIDDLKIKAIDGKYLVGVIDETASYKNSTVKDINDNGKTNDVFTVVAYKIDDPAKLLTVGKTHSVPQGDLWVYIVDQNNNGIISDDAILCDYKFNYDTFDFQSGDDSKKAPFVFSANFDPSSNSLVINTCDGSHGSHCAGICGGNDIYGNKDYDGIAPGAYLVSLKIGNNILSGGSSTAEAMKKAYEYGVKFLEESGFDYGVYSMSYGIGSETPGRSEIEKFLETFSLEHPEIVIVTSNGNNGPGINSTGNPSGSWGVISAGAMISPATLKDLYGSLRKVDWITHFSSRGGETSKPDVIAPGSASSTVPAFEHGDAFWGTSMACPQVAGACAVLFSAALKNDLKVDGFMIKKAIKYTAKPLKGYTQLDYGCGLINIPKAYKYLEILVKRNDISKVSGYEIHTTNTYYPDNDGSAAFWKADGYFPASGEKQNVEVVPVFKTELSETEKHDFYRTYKLRSDASWLETDKSSFYIRGELSGEFNIMYNQSKMKKPGIYTGRIKAYTDDESNGGNPEFDFQASVVVPYEFSSANDFTREWNSKLNIGDIERYFINVPPGASTMNITLSPDAKKWFHMGLYIYKPNGDKAYYSLSGDTQNPREISFSVDKKNLCPGIWEVIPYCYYQSVKPSSFILKVQFFGIESYPQSITSLDYEIGEKPQGKCKIINQYDNLLNLKAKGQISGFESNYDVAQSDKLKYKKTIKVAGNISGVEFKISMPTEEYNKVTDLALNIYNTDGKAIYASGLSRKSKTIRFVPPAAGEYTLELVPGFVSADIKAMEWTFSVRERHFFSNPLPIKITDYPSKLYPGVVEDVKFKVNGQMLMPPNGTQIFGFIKLIDTSNDALAKKISIVVE
jgi:tripeptidyl-peptidase II